MGKETAIEVARKYAHVVKDFFPVKRVILFGSYARGDQRKYSDIDVAVVVNKIDKDILSSGALLQRLTRDVDINIEPILLEDGYDPSGFLDHIDASGIVVYVADQVDVEK